MYKKTANINDSLDGGGGLVFTIHLKFSPLFISLKFLGYSLKYDLLFVNSKKGGKEI